MQKAPINLSMEIEKDLVSDPNNMQPILKLIKVKGQFGLFLVENAG
jgi:hypothetical protein